MKQILALLITLALFGCATAYKMNKVELGMTKSEVIQAIGNPISVSAQGKSEYLNYKLYETSDDVWGGGTTPYYVRLVGGQVESYGRKGDFGSIIQDSSKIQEETITVEIISNPPGANIEVNNDYIGKTPCAVSLPANYKGEFTRNTIVQALPVIGGQYTQQKSFIGGYDDFIANDVIPKRIFFDMNLQPVQPEINVNNYE